MGQFLTSHPRWSSTLNEGLIMYWLREWDTDSVAIWDLIRDTKTHRQQVQSSLNTAQPQQVNRRHLSPLAEQPSRAELWPWILLYPRCLLRSTLALALPSVARRAFFYLGETGNAFKIRIIFRQCKSCFLFSSTPVTVCQRQIEGKNFPICLIAQRALADSTTGPWAVSSKGGYHLSSSALSRLRNINST